MMTFPSIVGDVLDPRRRIIASIENRSRDAVEYILNYQMQKTRAL